MPVSRASMNALSAIVCVVSLAALGGVARGSSPVLQSAFQSYKFDLQAIAPIQVADLDHAGSPEIVSGATDNHQHFYIIVSRLVFGKWQRVQTIGLITGPPTFVTSDVNHDGYPDLVYLNNSSLFARVNDGTGNFGAEQAIAGSGTPPTDFMQTLILFHRASTGDEFFALEASGAFVIFRDSVEPNGTHDYVEVSRELNTALYETFNDNSDLYGLPPIAAEADLNGDGVPDVAAVTEPGAPDNNQPAVRLFMGAANGTYASPVDIFLNDPYSQPEFIYAVDVDGDGDTDLVVGQMDMEVAVFTNDGAGHFTQTTSVPPNLGRTDDPTIHAVPVDVNGDGRADYLIETVDNLSSTLVFDLYGNLLHQLPSGISPFAVAISDVDGDGSPDLVVLGRGLPPPLDVYLGRGGDHFGDALQNVVLPETPVSVAVGDLDSDGTPDLALVGYQDLTTVLSSSPTVATPYALPFGDVGTDVAVGAGVGAQPTAVQVVTTLSSHQPARFPSGGGGVLGAPSVFGGNTNEEVVVATGDLNGDHRYDIAAAILNGGRDTVIVWLSTASGFLPPVEYAVASYVQDIAIADLNGDGAPDIVTASDAGSVSVLLNQGNGTMGIATDYLIPGGLSPTSLAIGSFVGNDEYPDVALAIPDKNEVYVFQGNGLGALVPLGAYPVEPGPAVVRAGDVDADGNTDLVTANTPANTVSVLAGTKVGTLHSLADAVSYGVCQAPKDIALGNFAHHANGALDVVAIGNRTIPGFALLAASARPLAATPSTEWDAFYMHSVPQVTAAVPPASLIESLELAVAPNPARERVELTFALPRDGRATVDVFDLTGRRVARLADGAFATGVHRVHWDGRDRANGRVAAGVYLARLTTAAGSATRRVVWMR